MSGLKNKTTTQVKQLNKKIQESIDKKFLKSSKRIREKNREY